jgi:Mrp family chromosome partitioning ATPase
MQCAHRRDEREAFPAGSQSDQPCGELLDLTDYLQGFNPFGKPLTGARFLEPRGKSARGVGNMAQPHFIVFANEKGGTGKSTTAVHTAVALAATGHVVGALDLDSRQRTMTRYLENRDATMRRLGKNLPQAKYRVFEGDSVEGMELALLVRHIDSRQE